MRLSNVPAPHPDEYLLSYLLRTLNLNGIDMDVFEQFFVGRNNFQFSAHIFETKQEFLPFVQSLPVNYNIDARELFLSLSIFCFQSLFMSQEEQLQYVNNVFRKVDKLNTQLMPRTKMICVCPSCWEEDFKKYNEPYFHRVHQLPGVSACPRHHIQLYMFSGKTKNIARFSLNDYMACESTLSDKDQIAYAEYAQTLLLSDVHSDKSRIIAMIKKEFSERGYNSLLSGASPYKDLTTWEHNALLCVSFNISEDYFNQSFLAMHHSTPEKLLSILMFLFPDPQELIKQLTIEKELIGQYSCSSCGTVYFAAPLAQETGWGCPVCDAQLSYTERFSRIVHILGNGEYEVREPHISNAKRTKLYHCVCGKEFGIYPRDFIYRGKRCTYCNQTSEKNQTQHRKGAE